MITWMLGTFCKYSSIFKRMFFRNSLKFICQQLIFFLINGNASYICHNFIDCELLEELLNTKDLWLPWFACDSFIFLQIASKTAICFSLLFVQWISNKDIQRFTANAFIYLFIYFWSLVILGLHQRPTEVPRLVVR